MKKLTTPPLAAAFDAYKARIPGHFRPNQQFYDQVGINRKRFGQLLRGETQMYTEEAKQLATFFDIPVNHFI